MNTISDIFSCQKCGYCCHGKTTVSLNEEDQQRMVAALRLSREEVKKRYWRISGSVIQMKTAEGHCIFYNNGCTVYEGRPWRCAQWPLVPAILAERDNFTTISESCPGINKEISYEEFCAILKDYLQNDGQ